MNCQHNALILIRFDGEYMYQNLQTASCASTVSRQLALQSGIRYSARTDASQNAFGEIDCQSVLAPKHPA